MLQLNDTNSTFIDLSKKKLTGIKSVFSEPITATTDIESGNKLTLTFRSGDVELEETFTYRIDDHAREDYKMLVDMIENIPRMLLEKRT